MSKIDRGGQAFPTAVDDVGQPIKKGMTLRDYFAGQALAGMKVPAEKSPGWWERECAWAAYSIADAMLKARKDTTS